MESWGTIIAAFIALVGTLYTLNRNIKQQSIENERAKWRERVRELASRIAYQLNLKDIAELEIRLNPLDLNDQEIVENAKKLLESYNKDKRNNFLNQVARLLKYDWERAKNDTGLFGFLTTIDQGLIREYEYRGKAKNQEPASSLSGNTGSKDRKTNS